MKTELDFVEIWQRAIPYAQFVREAQEHKSLWEGVYRTARIPDWALQRACELGRDVFVLAIAEDWCGDASNTVPILAKLGDVAECLEMRVLKRDENPSVMDHYLTDGTRSIPIVILLDRDFQEIGHWGPRPAALQRWVLEHKDRMSKEERYPHVRRWYARDRGKTTLREVLDLLVEQHVHRRVLPVV